MVIRAMRVVEHIGASIFRNLGGSSVMRQDRNAKGVEGVENGEADPFPTDGLGSVI